MIRLASVAVPVPQLDLLTYRIPDGIETPAAGARVLVPMGTRTLTGCVIGTADVPDDDPRAAADGLRDIFDVLDGEAYVPADVLSAGRLGRRVLRVRPGRGDRRRRAVDGLAGKPPRRLGDQRGDSRRGGGCDPAARGAGVPGARDRRCRAEPARVDAPHAARRRAPGARPAARPPLAHALRTLEAARLRRGLAGPRGRGRRVQDRARGGTDGAGARRGRTARTRRASGSARGSASC